MVVVKEKVKVLRISGRQKRGRNEERKKENAEGLVNVEREGNEIDHFSE